MRCYAWPKMKRHVCNCVEPKSFHRKPFIVTHLEFECATKWVYSMSFASGQYINYSRPLAKPKKKTNKNCVKLCV